MVDLSFLKDFTKGDTAKMQRYIDMYLRIAPTTFQQMQEAVNSQDWEQLRIGAHSLKPQAEYMGATELKVALALIEENVESGRYKELPNAFQLASQLFRESEESLRKALLDLV